MGLEIIQIILPFRGKSHIPQFLPRPEGHGLGLNVSCH